MFPFPPDPTDGQQVLHRSVDGLLLATYHASTNSWQISRGYVPEPAVAGKVAGTIHLQDLSNTGLLAGARDGQTIKFVAATGDWMPADMATGTGGSSTGGGISIPGPQGVKGDTGPQGIPGVGTQGPKGDTGPQGIPGVGTKGDTGPQGIQGVQGIQGPPGGGTGTGGTVTQGPQGIQGPVGPAGPKGDPGVGTQGPKGDTGPQGIPGVGTQGPKGDTGPAGPAGADSTVAGPQGPKGDVGPQGPAGTGGSGGGLTAVNLGYDPASRTITNSGGTPAVLPEATAAAAGLITAAQVGNIDAAILRTDALRTDVNNLKAASIPATGTATITRFLRDDNTWNVAVQSDPQATGGVPVINMFSVTQAQYDAITIKLPAALYVISG